MDEMDPASVVEKLRAGESVTYNGRFLDHDPVARLVWATDEYGCDRLAAVGRGPDDQYLERAAAWLFHVRQIPHPLEPASPS